MKLVITIPQHLADSFFEKKGELSLAAWALEAMKQMPPSTRIPTKGENKPNENCKNQLSTCTDHHPG